MNVFENLPHDKKERIINAAMSVFAVHGYRKTSVSDIASEADISKAMIFTYFGSKLGCYEYVCDELFRVSVGKYDKIKDQVFEVTDFFERTILFVKLKAEILKQYPALLAFGLSMYKETAKEARPVVNRIMAETFQLFSAMSSVGIDPSKFKNPEDTAYVSKMVRWCSQGCTDEWLMGSGESIETVLDDFIDCMKTLRKHFYKEEYSDGND